MVVVFRRKPSNLVFGMSLASASPPPWRTGGKGGPYNGTYQKVEAFNNAPLYHCEEIGWIFYNRKSSTWRMRADTGTTFGRGWMKSRAVTFCYFLIL